MSSTGRSAVRREADYYPTPSWVTRAILQHLPIAGSVLEPCAGDGAIVRELLAAGAEVDAIELDPERALACAASSNNGSADVIEADALDGHGDGEALWRAPHVLPRRPSFYSRPEGRTGSTDSSAYGWFVWGPGRGGRWQILDVEPAPKRGVRPA
jgi:hypothetical protein